MKIGAKHIRLKKRTSLVVPAIFWAYAAAYLYETWHLLGDQSMLTVRILLVAIAVFTIVSIKEDLVIEPNPPLPDKQETGGEKRFAFAESQAFKNSCFALFVFFYLLFMDYLGFILATFLFVLAVSFWLGVRNKLVLLLAPLISSCALFYIFRNLLYVRLPLGLLADIL